MSDACTTILVGVVSMVSEIKLAFKIGQMCCLIKLKNALNARNNAENETIQ